MRTIVVVLTMVQRGLDRSLLEEHNLMLAQILPVCRPPVRNPGELK